jgi:hypothetical protein
MADITDLLSTLMSGGSQQPQQPAEAGVQDSGVKALNSEIGTGNILARLRGGQGGQSALGSALGAAGGGMAGVKTDGSRFGAFAQGLAGGMKSAADQRAAQAKQNLETLKAQWDQNFKLKQLEETKQAHQTLAKYYEGLIENGKNKKSKDEDPINDIYKTELARGQAASRFGIKDPTLNKAASDPMAAPEERAAAKVELDRRQKLFDEWDAKQPWSKDGKKGSTAIPSGTPAPAGDDGEENGGADNPNPTPDIPLPPKRPTDLPTDGTPVAQETMRPVIGPDGQKYLWGEKSGLQPFNDGQAAAAPPDPSAAAPGMTPDTTLPGFAG